MCGLVGMAGDIRADHVKAFNDMLLFDYIRGRHSTGVGSVSAYNKETLVLKDAVDPITLIEMYKGYSNVVSTAKQVIIGHNRHATVGKVNRANAHPFAFDNILGAHNGTLDTSCLSSLEENLRGETDSERLYRTIARRGIEETIPLISGAWALTFHNKETGGLYFLRNDQRPLFYCFSEDMKMIFWASEAWMMAVALAQHKIKHKPIVETKPDHLYGWTVPKTNQVFGEEPTLTPMEGKKSENFRHYGGYYQKSRDESSGNNGTGKRISNAWDLPEREEAHRSAWLKAGSIVSAEDKQRARDDVYWAVYGDGWFDAQTDLIGVVNPWPAALILVKDLREAWEEGFKKGKEDYAKKKKKEKAEQTPKLPAPVDGNVISLHGKTNVRLKTRRGPGGKAITAIDFRDLTGHECGWCNNPVDFTDEGFFGTCLGQVMYVCEECAKDKSQLEGVVSNA